MKIDAHRQQFILALTLTFAVIGFLFYGSHLGTLDTEVMMFLLGAITSAFITSAHFYFRRANPAADNGPPANPSAPGG